MLGVPDVVSVGDTMRPAGGTPQSTTPRATGIDDDCDTLVWTDEYVRPDGDDVAASGIARRRGTPSQLECQAVSPRRYAVIQAGTPAFRSTMPPVTASTTTATATNVDEDYVADRHRRVVWVLRATGNAESAAVQAGEVEHLRFVPGGQRRSADDATCDGMDDDCDGTFVDD